MHRASIFPSVFAVVLLALVALGHTAPSAAQDASPMAAGQDFVGSWRLTISADEGPPFPGLVTFGADGTVVASPPPVVPPPPGSPGSVAFTTSGHGAWEASSPDMAIFTFVVLEADGKGSPRGTLTIRGNITLGTDGRTFSGEAVVTIADPGGTTVATIPETIQATRIVAEAPGTPPAATPAA